MLTSPLTRLRRLSLRARCWALNATHPGLSLQRRNVAARAGALTAMSLKDYGNDTADSRNFELSGWSDQHDGNTTRRMGKIVYEGTTQVVMR